MIAFPEMLIPAALEAGMKVPEDTENYDINEYPHFNVFCNMQLGQPMPNWTCHWSNAKVIASIPTNKIKEITMGDIFAMGFEIGRSN